VRRYASALGDTRHDAPAVERPAVDSLEVSVSGDAPRRLTRDALDRGVRLVVEGCRYRVALASPMGESPLPTGPGRFEPRFSLELSVPAPHEGEIELPLNASDAVLSLALPEVGGVTSVAGADGAVRITTFEPRLGGALEGTVRGTLRRGQSDLSVEGRFATFVRDLDPLPERCGSTDGEG